MSSFNQFGETLKPKAPFAVLRPYIAVLASLTLVLGLIAAAHVASRQIPISFLLLIPIAVGAFLGGLGPGLFASILGLAADHGLFRESAFDAQRLFPHVDQQIRFVLFVAEGLLLSGIGHWHRLAGLNARESVRRRRMLEQEIGRRQILEESLARSQRAAKSQFDEIESLYAAVPAGLCFLDRDLRFVRINRRLAEIHGIPAEAHIGRSVQEAVPEIGLAIVPLLRRAIASGEPILKEEISVAMPKGSQTARNLQLSVFPVKEDGEFVSGINVIVEDISAQVSYGEKTRLLLALEAGRMAVWEFDFPAGVITWLDPMNIRPATDFEGAFLAWVQGIAKRDLPSVSEAENLPVQRYGREFRIILPDGNLAWMKAVGQPVLDDQGRCQRLSGVLSDITDRKRAEESLRRVEEAEEAMREMDRKKDEFIGLLAHELRNPLAPILTSAQLLKRRGSERPELIESAADSIERQVKHLTRLINDLLDVSRIARGKLKLSFEVADMASAIAQAIEACRPVIEKNRQELVLKGTDQPLRLWGDPARLSQIVANLLMNAAKFTPVSGRIELAMNQAEKEVSIRIRDNGIGIEPDELDHIFEPFVQFERPLHSGHGGLGIGLALVKSLVEMHGGQISAASAGKNQGSEFSIRLPLS